MEHKNTTIGVDRRDYFAAAVLQGMCASSIYTSDMSTEEVAILAYSFADAMIETSAKTNGTDK